MAINFREEGLSAQVWGPRGRGRGSTDSCQGNKPAAPPSATFLSQLLFNIGCGCKEMNSNYSKRTPVPGEAMMGWNPGA